MERLVQVHFMGWSSKFDRWIRPDSELIRAPTHDLKVTLYSALCFLLALLLTSFAILLFSLIY